MDCAGMTLHYVSIPVQCQLRWNLDTVCKWAGVGVNFCVCEYSILLSYIDLSRVLQLS
jgi:hypothetical protein